MAHQGMERRKAQRVDARLKLEVNLPGAAPGSKATLETINISSSGVYFRSTHFIEPMTKLAMDIEVSVAEAEDAGATAMVSCEGLVVRVSPEAETADCDNYEVAVFFTNIAPDGMANLERHIALLMRDLD